jgi:hypothetical protein
VKDAQSQIPHQVPFCEPAEYGWKFSQVAQLIVNFQFDANDGKGLRAPGTGDAGLGLEGYPGFSYVVYLGNKKSGT